SRAENPTMPSLTPQRRVPRALTSTSVGPAAAAGDAARTLASATAAAMNNTRALARIVDGGTRRIIAGPRGGFGAAWRRRGERRTNGADDRDPSAPRGVPREDIGARDRSAWKNAPTHGAARAAEEPTDPGGSPPGRTGWGVSSENAGPVAFADPPSVGT